MPWEELCISERDSKEFAASFKKKARFLVDECLGPEVAEVLRSNKWNAVFVGEVGLVHHPDENVLAVAWRDNRILLTHDRDFLDDRRFPCHRTTSPEVLPGLKRLEQSWP